MGLADGLEEPAFVGMRRHRGPDLAERAPPLLLCVLYQVGCHLVLVHPDERLGIRGSCALGFSWTLDCERVLAGGVSR